MTEAAKVNLSALRVAQNESTLKRELLAHGFQKRDEVTFVLNDTVVILGDNTTKIAADSIRTYTDPCDLLKELYQDSFALTYCDSLFLDLLRRFPDAPRLKSNGKNYLLIKGTIMVGFNGLDFSVSSSFGSWGVEGIKEENGKVSLVKVKELLRLIDEQ